MRRVISNVRFLSNYDAMPQYFLANATSLNTLYVLTLITTNANMETHAYDKVVLAIVFLGFSSRSSSCPPVAA